MIILRRNVRNIRTVSDYTFWEKIKEWILWSPYFFWQYKLNALYWKSMIHVGLVFFTSHKTHCKIIKMIKIIKLP
jgi:hypothetical protein